MHYIDGDGKCCYKIVCEEKTLEYIVPIYEIVPRLLDLVRIRSFLQILKQEA